MITSKKLPPAPPKYDQVNESSLRRALDEHIREDVDMHRGTGDGRWTPTISGEINCSDVVVTRASYVKNGRAVAIQVNGTFTVTSTATKTQFKLTVPFVPDAAFAGIATGNLAPMGAISNYAGPVANVYVDFEADSGVTAGSQVWIASATYIT